MLASGFCTIVLFMAALMSVIAGKGCFALLSWMKRWNTQ